MISVCKTLLFVLCAFVLSGCVGTSVKSERQFQVVAQPQHLSIGVLANNTALVSFCGDAAEVICTSNVHDSDLFAKAWLRAGQFATVAVGNGEADYEILLGTAVAETGVRTVHYRAVLTWNGQLIREVIGHLPVPVDGDLEGLLADAIAAELEQQSAFSAATLHAALASADYRSVLRLPARINAFQRVESHVFHHPLLGAQSRYSDPQLDGGRVDVYVYPIQAASWEEPELALRDESRRVQDDMLMLHQNGIWVQYAVSAPIVSQWLVAGTPSPVLYFSGEYADKNYQPFDTYIKLRASIPRNSGSVDIDGFARQLLDAIIVPLESKFMQRVRAGWRQPEPAAS
jgi:hypothetical protein